LGVRTDSSFGPDVRELCNHFPPQQLSRRCIDEPCTQKNRGNFAKHGLSFEDAEQVFAGPCVTFVDDRFDYGEE
jgi:hypothetical protein